MPISRDAVRAKYDNHCAYCGVELGKFQVDHIVPKYAGGSDEIANLNPACCRCNNRKSVLTVEQFRHEIQQQVDRLRRNVAGFRLASDFGLVAETGAKVRFYFERIGGEA